MPVNVVIMFTFMVYFAVMLAIGYYAFLRTKSTSDYFLGGRSLGPWTTAMSAGASDMSGWLLLSLPGYAFASGLEAFWLAGGLLAGSWLNWLIVAKRLRIYSLVLNDSLTLPEYLSNRFNDKSGYLQPISALFVLVFFLFYTSSAFVAGGKLFESVFALDYHWALLIGSFSVISYTLFGGFLAVCWTDLVQGLLMSIALLLVPIMAFNVCGGASSVYVDINAFNSEFFNIFTDNTGKPLSVIAILSLLGWGFGYFGQPHIMARFKAVKSHKELPFARRIAIIWTCIGMFGALMVGLVGVVYTQQMGVYLDDPEKIFMLLVNTLFHPIIAGILLAAILAAIMSTADSQLLVCSTAFAEDFYRDIFRQSAEQREILLAGRLAVVGIAIVATLFAWSPDNSVLDLVSYAWAGLGAAFGPVLIFSLYWRRMTSSGAIAGVIVGGATVVIWKASGGWFDLYEIIPGVVLSAFAVVIASYLSTPPSKKVSECYDNVQSLLIDSAH